MTTYNVNIIKHSKLHICENSVSSEPWMKSIIYLQLILLLVVVICKSSRKLIILRVYYVQNVNDIMFILILSINNISSLIVYQFYNELIIAKHVVSTILSIKLV